MGKERTDGDVLRERSVSSIESHSFEGLGSGETLIRVPGTLEKTNVESDQGEVRGRGGEKENATNHPPFP